jgi:hypothetical protein
LTEDLDLLESEENILDVVDRDYILSYSAHLEDDRIQKRKPIGEPILKIWLEKEYYKAFKERFNSKRC